MSDSSLSDASVSHASLEASLRGAVKRIWKTNAEDLTIKRIRTSVEHELHLEDGFFKSHAEWNARSKDVIRSEVSAHQADGRSESSPKREALPASKESTKENKKRLSMNMTGQKKRRRKDLSDDEDNSNNEMVKPRDEKHASDGSSPKISSSRLVAKNSDDGPIAGPIDAQSESDMSVLVDEDVKPGKKSRNSTSKKPKHKPKKSGTSKAAKSSQQPADPDVEEIKRLQGWLVKCGIRKMWYKELAPHESSKAKIRHLREMLADAGMTGRYSLEKATQIRDERELKADLEAVQAGDKHWGKRDSEDDDGRPRRKLAKGLQELDFLSGDGEETD